jgi:hypothetical protein
VQPSVTAAIAARLEAHSVPEPNTGCQLWLASLGSTGYGQLRFRGRTLKAHRAAWESAFGPVPAGLVLRHRCDQRQCVNPAHLQLGTHAENMGDMVRRGRSSHGVRHQELSRARARRGERHGMAKLTEHQVREIRQLAAAGRLSQREIGRRYGIDQSIVSDIHRRALWGHIP